jgi:lysophospholipase L1-like esterase
MSKRLKSIAAGVALLGASVAIALGAAEVALRLFPQLMPEEAQLRLHWQEIGQSETAQSMTVSDPRFGFLYQPHFTGRTSRGDFDYTFHTNEHGFRNPSPWPERADVVVVGDSLAFSYGVDDEEAWSRLVTESLPGIDIINLGLPGFGPQQYLRVLESFGFDLRPKLVLFCLFPGNDVSDAGRFDQWLKAGATSDYRQWRQDGASTGTIHSLRELLTQSYLVTLVRAARKEMLTRLSGRTIDFPDGARIQLAPAVYAFAEQQARPDHPHFRLVLDTIDQARALAARNHSAFLVVLMPTKEEVYLPLLDEPPPVAVAPFVTELAAAGIPYLDLTPYLQAAARQGERLFFEVDGHPNAAGYRLIARVVADHLKEFGTSYGLPD